MDQATALPFAEPTSATAHPRHGASRAAFTFPTSPLAEALFGAWSNGHTPAAQARGVVASALLADGPRPEFAADLALFGQFVGSWDLEVVNYPVDAAPQEETGEWHFAWALDGRAIVDVWISPARDHRTHRRDAGDYGLTVRFFDPDLAAWRSTWLGPVRRIVRPFIARAVGEEIVLSGSFEAGVETRWIFSQITRERFHWRCVQSTDGWASQRLLQEMRAFRQPAAAFAD